MDLSGRVLSGTYQISRLIGTGGMGKVYEARNIRLEKKYAIKVLSAEASANLELVRRFRREAKIASDLGHPHIVDVHDVDKTEDGLNFMVMEFLGGKDLGEQLSRTARLPVQDAVAITNQVCSALQAAHRSEIIHRDLKPENIFLCDTEGGLISVKVLDFGISKILGSTSIHTRDSHILGTPHYMAPEQAEGKPDEMGP